MSTCDRDLCWGSSSTKKPPDTSKVSRHSRNDTYKGQELIVCNMVWWKQTRHLVLLNTIVQKQQDTTLRISPILACSLQWSCSTTLETSWMIKRKEKKKKTQLSLFRGIVKDRSWSQHLESAILLRVTTQASLCRLPKKSSLNWDNTIAASMFEGSLSNYLNMSWSSCGINMDRQIMMWDSHG